MKKIEKYRDFEDILEKKYRESNYKVVDTGAESGRCMICFSSNGIYYPDTRAEVTRRLVEQDRYEWERIMQGESLQKYFQRIIFVRDIYKQWYVTGISHEVDTMEALIVLLRRLTQGYEVYTCGNSAGGYAAVLAGISLEAKCAYSFSGYFSLQEISKDAPLIEEGKTIPEKCRYYDLRPFMKDTNCEIFYFYPGKSEIDRQQAAYVEGNSHIHFLQMNQALHGATVWDATYKYIFTKELAEWPQLEKSDKMFSPMAFEVKMAGIGGSFRDLRQWLIYKFHRVMARIGF